MSVLPIPVAARSKERVCGRWLAGIASSNPTRDMDNLLVIAACCQVEVSVPVSAPSKERVCGRSLAGIASSNPTRGMDSLLVIVVCCQVEVSVSGWSLVQKSPSDCGVSECDREASVMRRPWPTRGFYVMDRGKYICTTLCTHRSGREIWVSHSDTGEDSSLVVCDDV